MAAQVMSPTTATTVLGTDDPAALAVATSAALYATAPVAVLAAADDQTGQATAAAAAERIGAPLLLTGPDGDPAGVGGELRRLGAGTVLAIGAGAERWATVTGGSTAAPTGGTPGGPPRVVTDERALPLLTRPASRPSVLVLTSDRPDQRAAAATARASGARVATVPGPDPRSWPSGSAPAPAEQVVALGSAFGSPELLQRRFAVAATGVQLPGGGQVAFPGRRMVALYGHPGAPALGVLGEQDVAAAISRAQALAARVPAAGGRARGADLRDHRHRRRRRAGTRRGLLRRGVPSSSCGPGWMRPAPRGCTCCSTCNPDARTS